jgi:hypothetical protein
MVDDAKWFEEPAGHLALTFELPDVGLVGAHSTELWEEHPRGGLSSLPNAMVARQRIGKKSCAQRTQRNAR